MNGSPLPRASLVAYAALAMPLAMAALPVYVHVPKLYGDDLGLSLGVVGAILLAARLLDALQDPLLGWWSDRIAVRSGDRRPFLIAAVPMLALGLIGLFHPPGVRGAALAAWLAGCLAVVYVGFSMGAISYFAMGAELSPDYHERTRVTAVRGAFGVAGVLIAAALPEWLAGAGGSLGEGLRRFSLLYVPILLLAAAATLFGTSAQREVRATNSSADQALWRSLSAPLSNSDFRWLLGVFVASGVASAIPATLILFYVQDVLERPELSGAFLALYFLFGAAGMPLWVAAARRAGKKRAWLLGMLMSVAAFVWAFTLGRGDAFGFGMVCTLSGIAYGAELALPPSILADVVDRQRGGGASRPEGAYFGLWQLTEKLNLALAAGFALPVLAAIGYRPGTVQVAMGPLSTMYAIVPCALKVLAVAILWLAPIDRVAGMNPTSQGGSQS